VTATLKQINVSYSKDADRIAVKFLDSNMVQVCAWLTYSLAADFLPHMAKVLELQHPVADSFAADTQANSQLNQNTDRDVVRLQFEKEAAAAGSRAETYLGDEQKIDEGEELLIQEGRLIARDQGFELILLAVNGRQVTINLTRNLALATLTNLERIVGQTVWVIPNLNNLNSTARGEVRH
tara:strand:- start:1524 stop:2066 length:543 start_codon:yes stop_codon:yes gene_type:complete